MFKDEPLWQVVLSIATAAVVLVMVATTAAKIYETETRPWGTECKEGDFKRGTDDAFPASCYRAAVGSICRRCHEPPPHCRNCERDAQELARGS
jgi:hypothetical protein